MPTYSDDPEPNVVLSGSVSPEAEETASLTEAADPTDAVEPNTVGTESEVEGDNDTEPEAAAEDEAARAPDDGVANDVVQWRIELDAPHNPFTAQLIFSDSGGDILWWPLDPVALNEIDAALTELRAEQVQALTGGSPSASKPASGPVSPSATRRPATPPQTGTRSWWARHKFLTFLIGLVVLLFLFGLLTGGSKV